MVDALLRGVRVGWKKYALLTVTLMKMVEYNGLYMYL
jgi:hypothetical protein